MPYHPLSFFRLSTGLLICSVLPGTLPAQEEPVSLVPLQVTASRLTDDPAVQPYAFYRHDRAELHSQVGRTALDRIDYGPGVIIQHTAPAQTSPYIRGLTGKQSLLLLDGVRLSHATMRGGPNQYSALIPDMSLEGIDALLGSSSVVNGSDGLTGALDFRLAPAGRDVSIPASPWTGIRIDTANGLQASGGVDGRSDAWRYSFEGSVYDFHDRIGGRDADDHVFGADKAAYDSIPNTAYRQQAYAARLAYDGLEDRVLSLSFGHTRQEDAPRPDGYFENSGDPGRIKRVYDPQTFTYLHLRDTWQPAAGGGFDHVITTAWWHQQDEAQLREDLRKNNSTYRRREYDDRIDSIGLESQALRTFGNHAVTFGLLTLTERTNNAYREFRNSAGVDPAGALPYRPEDWSENTTITDGAEYNTYAIYVQDLWSLSGNLDLLSGLRYSYMDWNVDVAEGNADDVTGSLRTRYFLNSDMMTFLGISKAFRAPNLNDLDGATDRGSSGTPSFGNPNLNPEVSYTAEAGWRFTRGKDHLGVSVFHTTIDDVIQTVFPAGGGPGRTQNGESATLRGFELLWDYGVPRWQRKGSRLALVGSISLVDSEAKVPQSDGTVITEPISRANRLYGRAGLRYDLNAHWWARAQARFHDAYDRDDLASGDDQDIRLTVPGNGDGTVDGYGVFDLSVGWQELTGHRWATLTLENLTDKTYRPLGSSVDAPGFNVVFSGGMRF